MAEGGKIRGERETRNKRGDIRRCWNEGGGKLGNFEWKRREGMRMGNKNTKIRCSAKKNNRNKKNR